MRSISDTVMRDEGFSLTELMVVSVLLVIVLMAAWLASATVTTASDGMIARNQAQTQGQQALERMTREIRQARIIFDPATGTSSTLKTPMNATSLTFYADIDHDSFTERVTYNLTTAGVLQRSVARTTLASPGPNDYGADSAPTILAQMTPGTANLFTIWTGDDPPVQTTDPTAVRAIGVTMNTVSKSGGSAVTVTFPTTQVQVRAYGDGYQPW